MKIITGLHEHIGNIKTSLALGTFDGVHLGHQKVIKAAVDADGLTPGIFTFSHSPQGILYGKMVRSLATQSIKQQLISDLGVKICITPNFNEVKEMHPFEFVEHLKNTYNAEYLCCGFNFRFGKNGEGNAQILKEAGKQLGINVGVIAPVMDGDLPVSSTRIREYISNGEIELATKLLAHPFSFDFEVIRGDGRGRLLDTPTINQKWPQNFVLPKFGVYATRIKIEDKWYKAVTNIGVRPTVGSDCVLSETYIINYSGDLYGEKVYVELIKFLREEQRFNNIEELRSAILNDVDTVKGLII